MAAHPSSSVLEDTWFADDEAAVEAKATESAAAVVARIHAVRPFPVAAKQLASRASDPRATTAEISSILEQDPALAARVLRLVNSAGFGLPVRCKTVMHAVSMLGVTRIRELALAASAFDLFEGDKEAAQQVVTHSLAVATVAKRLSLRFSVRGDDVYTCALLHDLGKLMLLDAERETYAALLKEHEHEAETMHLAERAAYGFDHAVLAGLMLKAWQIPSPVPEVVGFHHKPGRANDCPLATATMLHLLRIADMLVHHGDVEQPPAELFARLAANESAVALELTASDLVGIWPDVRTAVTGTDAEEEEPAASSEEAPPSSRRVPKKLESAEIACSECGHHTDGQLCPRCQSPLCRAHAVDRGCCAQCERDFQKPTKERTAIMQRLRDGGVSATVGVVIMIMGLFFRHTSAGGIAIAVASILMSCGMALVVHALQKRWDMRARFLGKLNLTLTEPPKAPEKP